VAQFLCEGLHKFSETKLISFIRNICQQEKDLKVIGLQNGMSRISRLVEQVLLRKLKGKGWNILILPAGPLSSSSALLVLSVQLSTDESYD